MPVRRRNVEFSHNEPLLCYLLALISKKVCDKRRSSYAYICAGLRRPMTAMDRYMEEKKLAALVVKARAGDKGAFEELYSEHARSILFHVRSLIVDKQNYTDVAQDVALEMYSHIGQLREPAAFRAWMHRIIRTTCADHNRSLRSSEIYLSSVDDEEALEAVEDVGSESDPEAVALATMEGNKLFAIVSELPAAYREVIVQRYYDDLSYKEIAQAQDISVTNVSTRLQRAMEAVRKRIGEMGEGYGTPDKVTAMKKERGNKVAQEQAADTNATRFDADLAGTEDDSLAENRVLNMADSPPDYSLKTEPDSSFLPASEEAGDTGENEITKDNIGLKASLYSGIALLIPDDTVKVVITSVNAKLIGAGAATTAAGSAVAATGIAKQGLMIITYVLSSIALIFSVVVGSTALAASEESGGLFGGEASEAKSTQTYDYSGSMHIVFLDSNGGSEDYNLVRIEVVEDTAAAVQIDWQLYSADQSAPQVNESTGGVSENGASMQSGIGASIDSSVLANLPPGTYKVAFTLVDDRGAKALITRSFTQL